MVLTETVEIFRDYVANTTLYSTRLGIAWHFLTCTFRLAMASLIGPQIWTGTDEGLSNAYIFYLQNRNFENVIFHRNLSAQPV